MHGRAVLHDSLRCAHASQAWRGLPRLEGSVLDGSVPEESTPLGGHVLTCRRAVSLSKVGQRLIKIRRTPRFLTAWRIASCRRGKPPMSCRCLSARPVSKLNSCSNGGRIGRKMDIVECHLRSASCRRRWLLVEKFFPQALQECLRAFGEPSDMSIRASCAIVWPQALVSINKYSRKVEQ